MTALLAADPDNPRSIDEASAAGLDASLRAFGDLSGVVWNRRTRQLVAGHQRLGRLEAAGATLEANADGEPARIVDPRTGEVFNVRVVDWPVERQRAANLAANNPRIAGEFTAAALPQLAALAALPEFAPLRLDALRDDLAKLAPVVIVEDEAPPAPTVAVSRRGDLWTLGTHRLLCGDSTKADDVARLMCGERAVLMATDPPYLVNYDGTNHPQSFSRKQRGIDPNKRWDEYVDPEGALQFVAQFLAQFLAHLHPRAPVYQWHATRRQALVERAWHDAGLLMHQTIVWVKARPILTRSDFLGQYEPCFYGWVEGQRPERDRRPPNSERNVWEISQRGEQDGIHPTQKPVEIFARPIRYHTRQGEVCAEPFCGSGTQIIAAEQLGRRCFAIEIAEAYVDVAVLRWQALTQREATLDGDGRAFAQVRDARATEAA